MKTVPVPKNYGPSGVATVRLSKTGVGVVFEETGEQFMFPREGMELPSYVNSGKWFVSVSSDGTKIFSIKPYAGKFVVRFQKFAAKKDQPPTYTPVKDDTGEFPKNYLKFKAVLEVIEPEQFAGVEYTLTLRAKNLINDYGFGNDKGRLVIQGDATRSKHVARLAEFMNTFGDDETEIPFSANPLKDIEAVFTRLGKLADVEVAKGWVNSLAPYSPPIKVTKKKK